MPGREREALEAWRTFADTFRTTNTQGQTKTWREYTSGAGYIDEERVIQPSAFPAFAEQILGWRVGENLAPEEAGEEGKPDFTPADPVTHPFVFETKNTKKGVELVGDEAQVKRYLTVGRSRIKSVVLTNLVGLRVFELDGGGNLVEVLAVDLRLLLSGRVADWEASGGARRFADFVDRFSFRELSAAEKVDRVRRTPPWNAAVEVTSSRWLLSRIDRVVCVLTDDALGRLKAGVCDDTSVVSDARRAAIEAELRHLYSRIATDGAQPDLAVFVAAGGNSDAGKALRQYAAHVAYYTATRMLLVRIWEDLGLLSPMLYDGGFDTEMSRFDGVIADVVDWTFHRANQTYPALFTADNNYTWFRPSDDHYAEVVYELANTYLGDIGSDILGEVYERMLERIDRKLAGVYYTPRDIIALIWDMIGFDAVAGDAEGEGRSLRVLDIATGSGGFLVEAARRLRERFEVQQQLGATLTAQTWLNGAVDGLNGVEVQRFSAYLAEINLLIQFGHVLSTGGAGRLPQVGVLNMDTLSLHNPDTLGGTTDRVDPLSLLDDTPDRARRAGAVRDPASNNFWMDVACGNPPYIGEKLAAPLMAKTRADYPYWEQFVGPHMDYLYWFLILGVSKVRPGGKFGFITTEYWLRAAGAGPLRRYLAERCAVERIVLFRDFRLFPDAPGQHSMIVTGKVLTDSDKAARAGGVKPRVSICAGSPPQGSRGPTLNAIAKGRSARYVDTFTAEVSPNTLGASSWAPCVYTPAENLRRRRVRQLPQVAIHVHKGVETTVNALKPGNERFLTPADLAAVGGPGSKPGIQLLNPGEVAALTGLNDAEKAALRTVVNTKDVYPYAAVPAPDANTVIYLPPPPSVAGQPIDQVIAGTPFPAGMPTLERRLAPFRGLLTESNRVKGERRPWWSLHRARANVFGDLPDPNQKWAPFVLTARWGAGGSLTVGLTPNGTSPASGLHAIRPDGDIPAAYVAAVFNSTVFQDIAASLPPGNLRSDDIRQLGLPDLTPNIPLLAGLGSQLADTVTRLVRVHGPRFPALPGALRTAFTLEVWPDDTWVPEPGPAAQWGTLSTVTWVTATAPGRGATVKPSALAVTDDLLGQHITLYAGGRELATVAVTPDNATGEGVLAACAATIRACIHRGGTLGDVLALPVPIHAGKLSDAYRTDRAAAQSEVDVYRRLRGEVDAVIDAALDT